MTHSAKKRTMKRVLNNEYNPTVSLSNEDPISFLLDDGSSPSATPTPNAVSTLDFGTPSPSTSTAPPSLCGISDDLKGMSMDSVHGAAESLSGNGAKEMARDGDGGAVQKKKKKRKRRLSATRDLALDLVLTVDDHSDAIEPVAKGQRTEPTASAAAESAATESAATATATAEQPEKAKEPQIVKSRKRRKRHSLSSNAIKKSMKNPTKKLFESLINGAGSETKEQSEGPPPPKKVKRTYGRRKGRRSRSRSIASAASLSMSLGSESTANAQPKSTEMDDVQTLSSSICPLLSRLIEDRVRGHRSWIALVSHFCLCRVGLRADPKQHSMFRKVDSLLALISRAEILLSNDERARLAQIEALRRNDDGHELWGEEWQSIYDRRRKKKRAPPPKKRERPAIQKKRAPPKGRKVTFCCFDLSTVSPPEYGEVDSAKHCQAVARLLVQSAKIGAKLFAVKSDTSWTRKSIAMLIEEFRAYAAALSTASNHKDRMRRNAAQFLLTQFEESYRHQMAYPMAERVHQQLSSLCRFTLKTIFNATEFVGKSRTVTVPKWYHQIGTFSVFDSGGQSIDGNQSNAAIPDDAEFIPYHAAEITLNLEALEALNCAMAEHRKQEKQGAAAKSVESVMDDLGILDNPHVFFTEMAQVLERVNPSIVGAAKKTKKRGQRTEFEKYLDSKWDDLRQCLRGIQSAKCKALYFYLPLLDFKHFLENVTV